MALSANFDARGWGDDWATQVISCETPGDYIAYIKTASWDSGDSQGFRGLQAKCKNGGSSMIGDNRIWSGGDPGATVRELLSMTGGFNNARAKGGWLLDSIQIAGPAGTVGGGGSSGDDKGNFTCPEGKVFNRFAGRWNEGTTRMTHFSVSCGDLKDCSQAKNLFTPECSHICSKDAAACQLKQLAYCNDPLNVTKPECRIFCEVSSNNCDQGYEAFCKALDPGVAIRDYGDICPCFLGSDYYLNYYTKLTQKIPAIAASIRPDRPACMFPKCSVATVKPYNAKTIPCDVPQNVQICLNQVSINNDGQINADSLEMAATNNCSQSSGSGGTGGTGKCSYGEWSACSQTCGAGVQIRSFTGNCATPLNQQPCMVVPCDTAGTTPKISTNQILIGVLVVAVLGFATYFFFFRKPVRKLVRKPKKVVKFEESPSEESPSDESPSE